MEQIFEEKKRLRAVLLLRRKALPEAYIREAGRRIQSRILASPQYRNAGSVFLYLSMPEEPGTGLILRQAFADGKKVYVPKCAGGRMAAVRIADADSLCPGFRGIPEPREVSETKKADELGLILVPCVSASLDGRRLGHGGGYYDRFLVRPLEQAFCLCFRRMLCPEIPMSPADVFMKHVVTEDPDI